MSYIIPVSFKAVSGLSGMRIYASIQAACFSAPIPFSTYAKVFTGLLFIRNRPRYNKQGAC